MNVFNGLNTSFKDGIYTFESGQSVGRGIADGENIEIAQKSTDTMDAVVSCPQLPVDARWLKNYRQVGTFGQTVKLKFLFACGISGNRQPMRGIK